MQAIPGVGLTWDCRAIRLISILRDALRTHPFGWWLSLRQPSGYGADKFLQLRDDEGRQVGLTI
jgi:hypothetical protein